MTTVVEAPSSAANPRLGVSSVILRPTVAITHAFRIVCDGTDQCNDLVQEHDLDSEQVGSRHREKKTIG